jgi:hypothetical protein
MRLVVLLGMLAFTLISAVIGVRLMRLARETRRVPELLVGVALFSYSAVGVPAAVLSAPLAEIGGRSVWLGVLVLHEMGMATGVSLLAFFVAVVFRSGAPWARPLCWAASVIYACLCAAYVAEMWRLGPDGGWSPALGHIHMGCLSVWALVLGWSALESLFYYGRMKRRLAHGLADPVHTNRFLVWGIGSTFATGVALLLVVVELLGIDFMKHPAPQLLLGVGGLSCSVCWYLTFLSPQSYRRWVRDRARVAA